MKTAFLVLLFIGALTCVSSAPVFNAYRFEQFDVILFNAINTRFNGFAYDIPHSNTSREDTAYVIGDNLFALNLTSFSVDYSDDFTFEHNYVSVGIFRDVLGRQCAIGPIQYGINGPQYGYAVTVALQVQNPGNILTSVGPLFAGVSPYAVTIDAWNPAEPIAYFVTWIQNAVFGNVLRLALLRVFVLPQDPTQGWRFNINSDSAMIYENYYTPYSDDFKPWVYHSHNHSFVLVVDPSSRAVYKYTIVNNTEPIVLDNIIHIPEFISSSSYSYDSEILFLGTHGADFSMSGSILALNATTFTKIQNFTLGLNESDPRAIIEVDGYLYVGLNGGPNILKIQLTEPHWSIIGYIRVPWSLVNIQAVTVDHPPQHLIFATKEPIAKIFRVSLEDFCSSPCPEFGYCKSGICYCNPNYEMANYQCNFIPAVIYRTVTTKNTGAEAALGVMFSITFLLAVAGWVMWYRTRGVGYTSVDEAK